MRRWIRASCSGCASARQRGWPASAAIIGHGSGDFVIAFSTAQRVEHEPSSLTTTQVVLADEQKVMGWLFPAVVESVEEAILNSLFRAETMVGRDGHTAYGLPVEQVAERVLKHQRLEEDR